MNGSNITSGTIADALLESTINRTNFVASASISALDFITASGGMHVGGTSDPNNLLLVKATNDYNIRLEEDGTGAEYFSIGVDNLGNLEFRTDENIEALTLEDGTGHVGVNTDPAYPLHVYSAPSTNTRALHIDHNGHSTSTHYGMYIDADNTTGTASTYGTHIDVDDASTSDTYTYGVSVSSTNNGGGTSARSYGIYTTAAGTSTGNKYGIFASASGTGTTWAGYFNGNVYTGGSSYVNGNLGIGTQAPADKVHVVESNREASLSYYNYSTFYYTAGVRGINTTGNNMPIVHGHYGTPTYKVWIQLRRRCLDAKNHNYPQYGGRGITVCARWNDFANFLADMGERPVGKTLDRIDNGLGYSPDNCRWATPKEQQSNRRNARVLTYKGRTQHIREWAAELRFKPECLIRRIYISGWGVDKAFNTPLVRVR